MVPTQDCFTLARAFEGLRLFPYADAAGFQTIGRGHRITPGEVLPHPFTEPDADDLLTADMHVACSAVVEMVHVPLTSSQLDALTDFCFNLGASTLLHSTLLRELNAGNFDAAAAELLVWDHARVDGVETVLQGLKLRRETEHALWSGDRATFLRNITLMLHD